MNRQVDFYDETGRPGTLYRTSEPGTGSTQYNLLYIRADLLRKYLAESKQVLVWCNWGERDWLAKMRDDGLIDNPARQRVFKEHSHIHQSFFVWGD